VDDCVFYFGAEVIPVEISHLDTDSLTVAAQ
jgi:hypothetical protein